MWKRAIVVFGALGAAACAAAPPVGLQPPQRGTTTVRVFNNVDRGYELTRLTLQVDGVDVSVSTIPPAGAAVGAATTVRLSPGEHTLAARAVALAAQGDHLIVGSQRAFLTTDAPAFLTVRVYSRAASMDPMEERVAVDVRVGDGDAAPDPCAERGPVDRDVCRASAALDRALRRRDVVLAACLRDRLAEMRKLADLREGTGAAETTELIQQRVAVISHRADECIGDEAMADDGAPVRPTPSGTARRVENSALR